MQEPITIVNTQESSPSLKKSVWLYNPVLDYLMDHPFLACTLMLAEGFVIGVFIAAVQDK